MQRTNQSVSETAQSHFSSPTINLNEPAPKVFSCELPLGAQWKTLHPKAKAEKSFDLVALRTDTLEPTTNHSKSQTKILQQRKNAPSQIFFCILYQKKIIFQNALA